MIVAILLTVIEREVHPIAFYLRTFIQAELNYSIHDKELLVIFKAFKK